MSTALWKMYHTKGAKIYLEDGSMIDLFDDHTKKNAYRMIESLANVIQTYGITTLKVEDPAMGADVIEEMINEILTKNFNYTNHVTLEVVE